VYQEWETGLQCCYFSQYYSVVYNICCLKIAPVCQEWETVLHCCYISQYYSVVYIFVAYKLLQCTGSGKLFCSAVILVSIIQLCTRLVLIGCSSVSVGGNCFAVLLF